MSEALSSVRNAFKDFLDERTEKQIIAFFGVLSFMVAVITTGWLEDVPSHWLTNSIIGFLIASNVFFATAWKEANTSFLVKAVGFAYICFIGQWQSFAMYEGKLDFKPLFPWTTHPAGLALVLVSVSAFVYYCFWWEEE
jgi:hypothetical protein